VLAPSRRLRDFCIVADPAVPRRLFVLDPEGNVIVGVYSSGAIGRLLPDDVAGLVQYVKSHQPA
jgi:hypothetical protein